MDVYASTLLCLCFNVIIFLFVKNHFQLVPEFKPDSVAFYFSNTVLHNLAFPKSVVFKYSIIVWLSIELFGSFEQVV